MIIIILILAFVLRLVNLNQSLWLDEAVQAITARNSIPFIFQEITGDFHPPLYYFLMHYWVRIFGSSEVALRMPSVLFGVATVYFLYKIAMRIHHKNVAILAAVLLATAPFHLYYSQEARMYSMATFFTVLSMFYFIKISNLKSQIFQRDFALYLVSTILLIYSDYYGFLVLLAQMIYLLIRKNYKFLLICLFAYLLVYLPWFPMLITQIKTGILATQILPGWGKLVNVSFLKAIPITLIKFTIGRITIFNKIIYGIVSLGIFGLLGWLGMTGVIRWTKDNNGNKKEWVVIVLMWFFIPLIASWLASIWIPNFQPFRLLLILPAFYLFLATGISRAKTSMIQIIEVSIIIVVNLISLSVYFFNPYFHREDWKGVTAYLLPQANSAALLPSSTSNWPIKYYDSKDKVNLVYGVVGAMEVITGQLPMISDRLSVTNTEKIYYIRYLVPVFDPQEKILAKLNAEGYTKVKEVSFNQIPVWEFRK